MKIINRIILIPLVIILFLVLILFQVNLSIRNTILSEAYFSSYSNEVNLGEKITEFYFQKMDDSLINEQMENREEVLQYYKDVFDKNVDQKWLAEQINVLLIGTHGYLINDIDNLPTLDIKPAKEIIIDMYVSQIIANSGSGGDIDSDMVNEMIRERLKLDTVKDELNLQEISNKIYAQDANPIYEFKNVIEWYKLNFLLLNIGIMILLIIIISMLVYKRKNVGLLVSRTLLLSGLAIILLGNIATKRLDSLKMIEGNSGLSYFNDILLEFSSGVISNFSSGGIIYLIIGFLILGATYLTHKKKPLLEEEKTIEVKSGYAKYIKVLVVFMSAAIIAFSVKYSVDDFRYRIDSFRTVVQDHSLKMNNMNAMKIIAESINAEFLIDFTGDIK